MKYAHTLIDNGVETVAVVLPLEIVPGFDPENPPQADTYGVPDEVQVGWVKDSSGKFVPPSAPPKPRVPQSVQNRQAKLALLSAGLFKRAEEIINSMEGDEGDAARIEWGATTFSRNSQFLKRMAQTLGLSEQQLDDLFILAATYE